jgi:antitoxin MazE
MRTRIQKWGNSLAVRIPRSIAADSRLAEGAEVEMVLEGGEIRLKPVLQKYDVETLVAGITPRNLHQEVDTGAPRGNEVW